MLKFSIASFLQHSEFSIQHYDGRSQVGAGIVVEAAHQGMLCERAMDGGSLNADPAAMHQAHLSKARGVRFVEVLLDD